MFVDAHVAKYGKVTSTSKIEKNTKGKEKSI